MKRNDAVVLLGLVLTLVLAMSTIISYTELYEFYDNKYHGVSLTIIEMMDLISPGELQSYQEYKKEFEARTIQTNFYMASSLITIALTVMFAISSRKGEQKKKTI